MSSAFISSPKKSTILTHLRPRFNTKYHLLFTSSQPPLVTIAATTKLPDTKLVWTLEADDEKKTNSAGDFTFVFLLERSPPILKPNPSSQSRKSSPKTAKRNRSSSASDSKSARDPDNEATFTPLTFNILVQPEISSKTVGLVYLNEACVSIVEGRVGQTFPT